MQAEGLRLLNNDLVIKDLPNHSLFHMPLEIFVEMCLKAIA